MDEKESPGRIRTAAARATRKQSKHAAWAAEMREHGWVAIHPFTRSTLAVLADTADARAFLGKILAGEVK